MQENNMEQIRVGIIGTGFTVGIANSHFKGYAQCDKTRVVACYDKVPGRAKLFMERHGIDGVESCDSLEELFSKVDAVSICLPNSEHVPMAIKAMEAGKHVLVEKPFSVNAHEAEKALECAKAHPELVAMTVLNFREQPAAMYLKEVVDSGMLGPIRFIKVMYGGGRIGNPNVLLEWRLQHDKSGTGSLGDFGAHMIDVSDWIFRKQCGKFISYTAAVTTNITHRGLVDPASPEGNRLGEEKAVVTNDDTAQFMAVSESGTMFSYMTSRMNLLGNSIEVVGEKGAFSISNQWGPTHVGMLCKDQILPGQSEIVPGMVSVAIPERIIEAGDVNVGHYGVISEFADCILNHKKPVRDFERGLFVQKQLDRFEKAAMKGMTVFSK